MSSGADKLYESFAVAIAAVVLVPIVAGLADAANVTGTTKTVLVLLATFIALGVLFYVLRNFMSSK